MPALGALGHGGAVGGRSHGEAHHDSADGPRSHARSGSSVDSHSAKEREGEGHGEASAGLQIVVGEELQPGSHGKELPADAHGEAGHGEQSAGALHGQAGQQEYDEKELGLSLTLIAIIMILLILLFFVNSKDADIVAYTWDVLSKGINVFVAVTIFLAINQPFSKASKMDAWWKASLFVGFLLAVSVWLLLKVILAQSSCEQKTVLIRTLGSLIAHLAAFTMINFWSHVQSIIASEHLIRDGGPLSVGLVVPVAGVTHWCLMVTLRFARQRYVAMDGVVDQTERLWLEKIQEVDLEAGALELAFLCMQAIRYAVHGLMPDVWGGLHGMVPSWPENWWLCFVAATSCALSMGLRRHCGEEDEDFGGKDAGCCLGVRHMVELVTEFFLFICSWALLFAFQGIFEASDPAPDGHTDIMLVRTAVALMSSGSAFIIISFLDSINDRLYNSDMCIHREAQGVIAAVGMMVGFAWERCFHHAFEVAAEGMSEVAQKIFHVHIGSRANDIPESIEVVIFVVGCAVMSLITICVTLWYITPRSIEATHKAKLEKSRQHQALMKQVFSDRWVDPDESVSPNDH